MRAGTNLLNSQTVAIKFVRSSSPDPALAPGAYALACSPFAGAQRAVLRRYHVTSADNLVRIGHCIRQEPRKSDAPQLRDEYRTYKILAGSRASTSQSLSVF